MGVRRGRSALETFRSSGPDTEQRPAMLTVSAQEYDIADVRPVFRKQAERTCSTDPSFDQ